ncbi:MAG: peptide chain release factor 1 [Candidatus Omnitrophota bacterium]
MFEKFEQKKLEYKKLEKELSSPELLSNREQYRIKSKKYADLKDIVAQYDQYLALVNEKKSLEKMIEEEGSDSEYSLLAKKELESVNNAIAGKSKQLEDILLDDDNTDYSRNIIMEIRAGTGGTEAGLFAADLYKMYVKYAASKGWKTSVISLSETELAGIKEVIFSIEGRNVFKFLRFEMGTHRVQRVPQTEASGRIHTSAATVAVLPEADDVEIDIRTQDLKIDTYRASGAGGQHVNVTDSAIRITHLPTGIIVSCQDERSQHKNKAKAMRVLKARILEKKQEEQRKTISDNRKKQVGSGDRSEKIRTYNFPENRVTDHRINLTIYNLANILQGENALDEFITSIEEEDRKLRLGTIT